MPRDAKVQMDPLNRKKMKKVQNLKWLGHYT